MMSAPIPSYAESTNQAANITYAPPPGSPPSSTPSSGPPPSLDPPPADLPPSYAVVDDIATRFTIYGTFIHTPTGPAYQISSFLDACMSKIRIRKLRAEEVAQLQAGAHTISFDDSSTIYEAHDPPFLTNEYFITGRSSKTLPGTLHLRFGLRRWHVLHIPSEGARPAEIMTCGKAGGFSRAIKQRRNETEPSLWKDSEGAIIATEVLKLDQWGKRMPTFEMKEGLDEICREMLLALWVSRLWASLGAATKYQV
ncbi:hypothetical protein ACN47E_000620 [Coniothyrium glycines]